MTLALALATAAMSGTSFTCTVDTAYLTIFAPSEEATASYRGNVLTLYTVSGDGELFPTKPRIRQVFDALPDSLTMALTTGDDMKLELVLSGYDVAAKTAAIKIDAQSAGESLGTLAGTCIASTETAETGKTGSTTP